MYGPNKLERGNKYFVIQITSGGGVEGDTTLSITTLRITTFSITTLIIIANKM